MNTTTEPIHEIKIYGRGKGPARAYRALTDYYITGTEKQALKEALRRYRATYSGMVPEIAEIGGVRQIPGAGRILWSAKVVEIPQFS